MNRTPSKLYEVTVMRTATDWDHPMSRATDAEGIMAIVKDKISSPFKRIEIRDVTYYNSPEATSLTLTENCPRMDGK